ncbi:MAG: hypothetical protein WA364_06085 [Candidatus Nitrosopolaris sp.]
MDFAAGLAVGGITAYEFEKCLGESIVSGGEREYSPANYRLIIIM